MRPNPFKSSFNTEVKGSHLFGLRKLVLTLERGPKDQNKTYFGVRFLGFNLLIGPFHKELAKRT